MSNFQSHDEAGEHKATHGKEAHNEPTELASKSHGQGLIEEGYARGSRPALPAAVVDNYVQATDSQIKDKAPSNDQVAEVFDRENPAKLPREQMSDINAQNLVRKEFETRGVPLVDGMKIELSGRRMDVAIVTDREGRTIMRTGDGDFYFKREADGQLRLNPKGDPSLTIQAAIIDRGRLSTKGGDEIPQAKPVAKVGVAADEAIKDAHSIQVSEKSSNFPMEKLSAGANVKELENTAGIGGLGQIQESMRTHAGSMEAGKESAISSNTMSSPLELTKGAGELTLRPGNLGLDSKADRKPDDIHGGSRAKETAANVEATDTKTHGTSLEQTRDKADMFLTEKGAQHQGGNEDALELLQRPEGNTFQSPLAGGKATSEGTVEVSTKSSENAAVGSLLGAENSQAARNEVSHTGEKKIAQAENVREVANSIRKSEQPEVAEVEGIGDSRAAENVSSFFDELVSTKTTELLETEDPEASKQKDNDEEGIGNIGTILVLDKLEDGKEKEAKDNDEELTEGQSKREQLRRAKYIVREKDTLESIAIRALRDVRLAPLVLEINKDVIPCQTKDGKLVVFLKAKMVILLPTATDINEFRGRMPPVGPVKYTYAFGEEPVQYQTPEEELAARFGGTAEDYVAGEVIATTNPKTDADNGIGKGKRTKKKTNDRIPSTSSDRQANVEALLGPLTSTKGDEGRIKYVVRLGDSLKSVAMRHPALKDITLWKLLAKVNEMPIATDDKGVPIASLKRGLTISIPTPDEIEHFYKCEKPNKRVSRSQDIQEAKQEKALPIEQGPKVEPESVEPSKIQPVLGPSVSEMDYTKQLFAAFEDDDSTYQEDKFRPQVEDLPPQSVSPLDSGKLADRELEQEIVQFDELARLVKSKGAASHKCGWKSRLELKQGEEWLSVVSYEIYEDVSLRHEYLQNGTRKTIRIDLPPKAVEELAENDLSSHWQDYISAFVSGQNVSK